jgi:two-component system phosphate regulon response regulator OmpR
MSDAAGRADDDERNVPDDDAAHLLVVDDDTRIRSLLMQFLSSNGFRVTVAGTAAEARRKLAGLDFDLLIVDVMMPGETGVELTRSLRVDKKVPILMLTALSETDSRIAGLEAGADDYLPKPFDPRELILRINNILRRGGPPPVPKVEQIVFGPYTFHIARRELKQGGETIKLTDREQDILPSLPTGPAKPSRATNLWPATQTLASAQSTFRSTGCAGKSSATRPIPSGCRPCAASATG